MKNHFLITQLFLFISIMSFAQPVVKKGIIKPYEVIIITINKSKIKAWLHSVDKEGLNLINKRTNLSPIRKAETNQTIPFDQITSMKIRKKGSAGKSALIGAGIGVGIGALMGAVVGSGVGRDSEREAEAAFQFGLAGALVFGVIGATLGAPFGLLNNKKYLINGNQSAYLKVYKELDLYSIKGQIATWDNRGH